jgi:cytoskeletal protein CcmA (bactofilin family)
MRPLHSHTLGAGMRIREWERYMVFHRKTEPAAPPAKATVVPAGQKPVAQHLAQQNMAAQMSGGYGSGAGHNSGQFEESLIGSDLSIEGQAITIRCKGTLRLNGNIQGDVHSRQLDVGRDAILTGSITAEAVDVHGRVNGAILSNKVVLHATAEVEGDISAENLSIEQGASFDGRSRRVRDPNEIAPQTEPAAAVSITKPAAAATAPSFGDHYNGSSAAPSGSVTYS